MPFLQCYRGWVENSGFSDLLFSFLFVPVLVFVSFSFLFLLISGSCLMTFLIFLHLIIRPSFLGLISHPFSKMFYHIYNPQLLWRISRLKANWNFRTENFRSRERKFHRWNFHSLEHSSPRTFVLWNFCSQHQN